MKKTQSKNEVEYCERLLKTIEGMPVVPNLPRIITAATITSGEKPDGKELPKLVEKSRKAGMTVENGFVYNKDADMMQCPAGELAVRKAVTGSKKTGSNQSQTYYFDIEKCKQCPHREGCYKEGAKSKTFSVTLKCDEHKQQQEFQETEEFKQLSKERYKIEAKNSELKNVLGYDVSMGNCLYATKIQGACTIFAANIKRIITILDEK